MKRIEGQMRGITKMMAEDRDCTEVLQQMTALEAAIRAAKSKVLAIHAAECIEDALQGDDIAAQREQFSELIELFGKVSR
ncbi:MAG: metal-sensitive transcriptional regulator [Novosphingobium sp.]|nr:metal-sensitive transcriptional regulator [Novosphingobium sp.]